MKQRNNKKRSLLLFTVFFFSPVITVTASDYHYACAIDSTYILSDADKDGERIAVLSEGDVCRVLSDGKEFSLVFSGGFTGYVDSNLLESDEETLSNIRSRKGVAADYDTYVYASPDETSPVIAERKKGATEIISSSEEDSVDGWTQVFAVTAEDGSMENGWMMNRDITPARIVPDAEPYINTEEDDGFLIADSKEILVKDAKRLREKARNIVALEKTIQKNNNTSSISHAKPGILNSHVGTVIGPSNCKETYYNLPMSGVVSIMRSKGFSEEEYPYWIREDGAKMLGPYIMCAANLKLRPRGSLVESSLGTCIVADTGDFIYTNPTQIDIAVSW